MHNRNFRDQVATAAQVLTPSIVVEPLDTLECAFQAARDIFTPPTQRELDRRLKEALERHHHATVAYNLRQGADATRLRDRKEWRIDSLIAHNPPNEHAEMPTARRARKPAARAAVRRKKRVRK